MTKPSLNLTAKDCTAITLVGHDYAAVRSAFENTAKTFTLKVCRNFAAIQVF